MPTKRKAKPAAPGPEDHVRTYLAYLADPYSIVDDREVRALTDAVDAASDPIDKVRALSALHAAQDHKGKGSEAERMFVQHALSWHQSVDVSVGALRKMGVTDSVLVEAGIMRAPAVEAPAPDRKRAPRIPLTEVLALLPPGRPFIAADVTVRLDRDYSTTHNYIVKLVQSGHVKDLGVDPSCSKRRRHLYQKVAAA